MVEEEDDNSVSDSSQTSNDKSSTSDRFSSSNGTNEHPQADERDEFREVRQMARDETRKVRFSRIVVTLLLLAVAVAVTVTTYLVLLANERGNFEAGVSKACIILQAKIMIRCAKIHFRFVVPAVLYNRC